MILLTLGLLLAAEPQAQLKIAATGVTSKGIDPTLTESLTVHLARAITGVHVVTARDISTLLGFERQKVLLGCTEDASSCMAELGDALGVEGVLVGEIVRLGNAVQINMRVVDPVGGKQLASAAEQVESDEEIFDALTRVGRKLSDQFLVAMGRQPVAGVAEVTKRLKGNRRFFPAPLAVGAASLAVGVAFFVLSETAWRRLTTGAPGSLMPAQASAIANDGNLFQILGTTFVTVGAAAAFLGFGLLLWGSGPSDAPSATLGLSPNGFAIAGTF